MQGHLAAGIAHRGAEVAVLLREPLTGDQSQPQVGGNGAVSRVVGQPGGQVEIGLLEDVGRVDPSLEPAVQPQPDHLPQPRPVTFPERSEGRVFARSGAKQEVFGVIRALNHRCPPTRRNAAGNRSSTGRGRKPRICP